LGIDQAGIKTIQCIGDCLAPGIIAAAVHSGHLAAREFEANVPEDIPFLRERILL
jgi:dimethylamine/trimethylamine dehydrogenase